MNCFNTPIYNLSIKNPFLNIQIKFEEYYPYAGGGNKGRKTHYIFRELIKEECDSVISCGGTQSNHARSVSIAASMHGMECHLVLHGKIEELDNPVGNLALMKLTGAKIYICDPENIKEMLLVIENKLRKEGKNPRIIPGGGHCLAGALAYAEAAQEIFDQCGGNQPDAIVLASGTGTTQAGLLAGIEKNEWTSRVIGVSIARNKDRGSKAVLDSYHEIRKYLKLKGSPRKIEFYDDFNCGGYNLISSSVTETIRSLSLKYGIILDPTYTGKAFNGLLELIRQKNISQDSQILFIHTGGLLNLLASNHFKV